MTFKPLLAASTKEEDLAGLAFPILWSPKLDGIRTLIHENGPVTRKIKLVPNEKLRAALSHPDLAGMDGEMIYGPTTDTKAFNHTQSCVMSGDGPCPYEADGRYLVFDDFSLPDIPFGQRFDILRRRVERLPEKLQQIVQVVPHKLVHNLDDLMNVERMVVERGFEGVMGRSPDGRYKFGRSTLKEGILFKIKRFADFDGQIVEVYEMMHNDNEKVADALGHSKRSSHQENKRPSGMLGGFTVESPEFPGQRFNVGPGTLTAEQKKQLWADRASLP
jgi:DNA ligase-1